MLSLGVFIDSTTNNTYASTWHRGTPKMLRGNYQAQRISAIEGFGYTVKVTKSSIIQQSSNNPQQVTNHLFYKKINGKTFRFSGYAHGIYGAKGSYADFIVCLKGKKFIQDSYKSYKKYGIRKLLLKNTPKRVTHFQNEGPIYHY